MEDIKLSPYINTVEYANISLPPKHLNNEIRQHLKDKLIRRFQNKNFRDHGFMVKIFRIMNCENAPFIPEDPSVSGQFKLTFSCRMCIPLVGKQLVAQVTSVQELMITSQNGPLRIYSAMTRINDEVFMLDNDNQLRYRREGGGGTVLLKEGDYVRVSIVRYSNNRSDRITCLGFLLGMATDEQIDRYCDDQYANTETDKLVEYEDYVKQQKAEIAAEAGEAKPDPESEGDRDKAAED